MGGGIARWMAALATSAPAGSVLVSTGTLDGARVADATLGATVDRVPVSSHRLKTPVGLVAWSRRAAALARERHARFAWCGTVRPAIYPAWWCRRAAGVPFGVIVHGSDIATLEGRMRRSAPRRAMFGTMLRHTSVFVANSSHTATRCEAFLDWAGIDRPVEVVRLGADPERFGVGPASGRAFRERHGLPDGDWLLTVARLVPHKGIDTAVRVLAALRHSHPRLHYLVVGQGPDRARLDGLARELDVAERVHILTDVPDDELPSAYAAADVYLGLSRVEGIEVEGFGIALAEAAASGLPVVAGRSGGTADAVTDGLTGLLVDPSDPSGAAGVVSSILQDAALRTRLGHGGRARVVEELNWHRMGAQMRELAAQHGRT